MKTWPVPFQAILDGDKLHDVRSCADRVFNVGDILRLREWLPKAGEYTGREVFVRVSYVTRDDWGLPPGLCILSIVVMAVTDKPPSGVLPSVSEMTPEEETEC